MMKGTWRESQKTNASASHRGRSHWVKTVILYLMKWGARDVRRAWIPVQDSKSDLGDSKAFRIYTSLQTISKTNIVGQLKVPYRVI